MTTDQEVLALDRHLHANLVKNARRYGYIAQLREDHDLTILSFHLSKGPFLVLVLISNLG